jgi:NADH-quinone oxidoreductase subunit M
VLGALVRSWVGRPRALIGIALHLGAGAAALLAGMLMLHGAYESSIGVSTFDLARYLDLAFPADVQRRVLIAWLIAFGVMVPVFPLHGWLPSAVADAPPAGAAVVLAAALKLGAFGFVRLALPLLPDAARTFAPAVVWVAALAMLFSMLQAFRQPDWRRVAAYLSATYTSAALLCMFLLSPVWLTTAMLQQIDQSLLTVAACVVVSAGTVGAAIRAYAVTGSAGQPRRALVAALVLTVGTLALWARASAGLARVTPALALIETSMGRVIARVNPAYAPLVKQPSDCGGPPSAAASSAPASWIVAAPCTDGGAPVEKR